MTSLQRYCNECIGRRLFPGCAIAFGRSNGIPRLLFAGHLTYEPDSPAVDADTWFDLASLTKPIATATATLRAVEQQHLSLETPLETFFPGIAVTKARLQHLLSHSSGLPAYVPFFETCSNGREVVERIVAAAPEYATGTRSVYSDLGFMLLGRLLEMTFERLFRAVISDLVLVPLELASVEFGPLPNPEGERRIAPTELDPRSGTFLQGLVHDENARLFGGAAGHAGLFGTIEGVSRFAQQILCTVTGRGRTLLPAPLLRAWTQRQPWLPDSSWGLGWDTPTPESSAGPSLSPRSFGHTGFTGTSVWIDPQQDFYVCILSNRVHPTRKTEGMKEARRTINALAASSLRGEIVHLFPS